MVKSFILHSQRLYVHYGHFNIREIRFFFVFFYFYCVCVRPTKVRIVVYMSPMLTGKMPEMKETNDESSWKKKKKNVISHSFRFVSFSKPVDLSIHSFYSMKKNVYALSRHVKSKQYMVSFIYRKFSIIRSCENKLPYILFASLTLSLCVSFSFCFVLSIFFFWSYITVSHPHEIPSNQPFTFQNVPLFVFLMVMFRFCATIYFHYELSLPL